MTITLLDILNEAQKTTRERELHELDYPVGTNSAGVHVNKSGLSACADETLTHETTTLSGLMEVSSVLCSSCLETLLNCSLGFDAMADTGWCALNTLGVAMRLRKNADEVLDTKPTWDHDILGYTGRVLQEVAVADWESALYQSILGEHLERTLNTIKDQLQKKLQEEPVQALLREQVRHRRHQDDTPHLVVWSRSRSWMFLISNDVKFINTLTSWGARETTDRRSTWLVVPADVKDWLHDNSITGGMVSSVQSTGAPEGAMLETTLGLWEPHKNDGILQDIEAAAQAARHVHS